MPKEKAVRSVTVQAFDEDGKLLKTCKGKAIVGALLRFSDEDIVDATGIFSGVMSSLEVAMLIDFICEAAPEAEKEAIKLTKEHEGRDLLH